MKTNKLKFENGDKVFFIADPHFNHENMATTWRGFKDVDAMNEYIINRWNEVVGGSDYIFILGDFYWGNYKKWPEILKRLNGKKVLILGNHDYKYYDNKLEEYFEFTCDRLNIDIEGQLIILDHYPMVEWASSQHGSWLFYGHIHENKTAYVAPNSYCCCAERQGYTPFTFKQIKEIMNNQFVSQNQFSHLQKHIFDNVDQDYIH